LDLRRRAGYKPSLGIGGNEGGLDMVKMIVL
jgi:hypothetical protein